MWPQLSHWIVCLKADGFFRPLDLHQLVFPLFVPSFSLFIIAKRANGLVLAALRLYILTLTSGGPV